MPHVIRIEHVGPARKARRLVFDDGSDPRLTSSAAVKKLGLQEAVEVDVRELDEALRAVEEPLARDKALRLLGYRDRSRAELTCRLRDVGYSSGLAHAVSDHLADAGLLDDGRFAAAWARSRAAAGMGPRRVQRELLDKGIDLDMIQNALDTEFPHERRVEMAVRSLRGARTRTRKEHDALVRKLVSRGHDFSAAIEAADTTVDSADDSQ